MHQTQIHLGLWIILAMGMAALLAGKLWSRGKLGEKVFKAARPSEAGPLLVVQLSAFGLVILLAIMDWRHRGWVEFWMNGLAQSAFYAFFGLYFLIFQQGRLIIFEKGLLASSVMAPWEKIRSYGFSQEGPYLELDLVLRAKDMPIWIKIVRDEDRQAIAQLLATKLAGKELTPQDAPSKTETLSRLFWIAISVGLLAALLMYLF
jgi:uncharacterized membrane protein YobD (UPF0266 family)